MKYIFTFVPLLLVFSFSSCSKSEKVDLSGQWRISYADTQEYRLPGIDVQSWDTVSLPIQTRKNVQVTWIRKDFFLSQNLRSEPLGIFIGKIIDTDIVYINGTEIGRSGSEPPHYIPMWNYNRYYFIPPGLLKEKNTIAIRAWASIDPKFADKIFISNLPMVHWHTTVHNTLARYLPMTTGILIFFLGILSIILFFFNRKERQNLLLGIISIFWGLVSIHYFNHNFGEFYNLKEKILYSVLALEMGMIFFYLEIILKMRNRLLEGLVVLISLSVIVTCFSWPLNDFMGSSGYFYIGISGIITQLIWGYLVLKALILKIPNARLIAIGYGLFMTGVIHDSLAIAGFFIIKVYLISLCYPALFLAFGVAFIRNFTSMQKDLKYMAEISEKNRLINLQKNELQNRNYLLEKDLQLARSIQQRLIPSKTPTDSIYTLYRPMEAIGGDFYDFIHFRDKNIIGILICDVSGHGVPAALITAVLKGYTEQAGDLRKNPSELFFYMNQSLYDLTGRNFITLFYGLYNYTTRVLTYSNAGHYPPVVIQKDKILPLPGARSAPIAAFSNMDLEKNNKLFTNNEIELQKGEKLFLYTDGLVETEMKEDHRIIFGNHEFHKNLLDLKDETPENLVKTIYKRLVEFQGSEDFKDDVCMICVDI